MTLLDQLDHLDFAVDALATPDFDKIVSEWKRLEEFKKSIVGNGGSRFNISVGDNGDVFLIPVQKAAAPPIPTGATLDELPSLHPRGGGR